MEFYARSAVIFRSPWRFNSQRDGILPRRCVLNRQRLYVSIPNGMEFYLAFLFLFYLLCRSFNSQRDGILQRHKAPRLDQKIVSIPNGMEFYISESSRYIQPDCSFNSQRDGILPYSGIFSSDPDVWFQFPTGWNSTKIFGLYRRI